MKTDRRFRLARIWSNRELKKISGLFDGAVVNVSAKEDIDKEGSTYRQYFNNASDYWLTNLDAAPDHGFQGRANEILLDLTQPLKSELDRKFDVVFNHTTLEHIFDIRTAFHNLCSLSKDVVILVLPFCQTEHETSSYRDYWRLAPSCIRELFSEEGFTTVYESANNDFNAAVYTFFVATRHPESWRSRMPAHTPIETAGRWVGQEPLRWKDLLSLFLRSLLRR